MKNITYLRNGKQALSWKRAFLYIYIYLMLCKSEGSFAGVRLGVMGSCRGGWQRGVGAAIGEAQVSRCTEPIFTLTCTLCRGAGLCKHQLCCAYAHRSPSAMQSQELEGQQLSDSSETPGRVCGSKRASAVPEELSQNCSVCCLMNMLCAFACFLLGKPSQRLAL